MFCSLYIFFLSFVFLFGVFATPPRVVDQRLWFVNQTILNVDFEVAVFQMEFDQDMFLSGDSFLCGRAEESCPETDCVPCDWSSQEPTGCDDVRCCGPAQKGGEAWDKVDDWCNRSTTTPYHTLNFNERSQVFTVEPGETVYFRFFVSEEFHCRPFKLSLRPFYGVPAVFLSNLYAVPSPENASWRKGTIPPTWGWAQNDALIVCPTSHVDYQLGTYSLGVFSWYSSSFDIEILVSPQDYPLVPPPGRILCEDVPESEIIGAQAGTDLPTFCLQDTETLTFDYDKSFASTLTEFVLPIPSGCHQVSLAISTEELGGALGLSCFPADSNQEVRPANSLISRWTAGGNRIVFPICSDIISYVRCSIHFWNPVLTNVIFSTVSIPISIPLAPSANTPSASFTYQESLTAMTPVIFGGVGNDVCADFFSSICWYWTVPSLSDPLIFWPPPPQLPKFDTEGLNLYEKYYNGTNAQPLKNTLTGVITMATDTSIVFSRDQLDQITVALIFLTNELGEPPVLPNNAYDPNGKTASSPSRYLPTITLSSFPQIDLSELCNRTSYARLQSVVNDGLTQILESDSLQTIEFYKYVLEILDAGIAGTSCTEAAIKAINTQVENVTLTEQTFCQYKSGTEEFSSDPCCNVSLKAIDCCTPFTIATNAEQFSTANSSLCGTPECADTFFEDLAQSLNLLKDRIQGCSSGIGNFHNELATAIEKQLDHVVRDCLYQVGLRDDFEGIDCVADFQCEQWSGRCNHQTKKCVLEQTTSEVEDAYLQCYISKMSSC